MDKCKSTKIVKMISKADTIRGDTEDRLNPFLLELGYSHFTWVRDALCVV